mgnify:CR=1 FL=1
MTEEALSKGMEISKAIKEVKEIISALESPYINQIYACNFWGEKETSKRITLERDGLLYSHIITHYKALLEQLEKEFKETWKV